MPWNILGLLDPRTVKTLARPYLATWLVREKLLIYCYFSKISPRSSISNVLTSKICSNTVRWSTYKKYLQFLFLLVHVLIWEMYHKLSNLSIGLIYYNSSIKYPWQSLLLSCFLYKKKKGQSQQTLAKELMSNFGDFTVNSFFLNVCHRCIHLPRYSAYIIKIYSEIESPYNVPLSGLKGSLEIHLLEHKS